MRLQIEVHENDVVRITTWAIKRGFQRVEPRKAWSEKEHKEAVRFLIDKLLAEAK